jgi:hypothetical protein
MRIVVVKSVPSAVGPPVDPHIEVNSGSSPSNATFSDVLHRADDLSTLSPDNSSQGFDQITNPTLIRMVHEDEHVRKGMIAVHRVELGRCLLNVPRNSVERWVISQPANNRSRRCFVELFVKPVLAGRFDLAERSEFSALEDLKIGRAAEKGFRPTIAI